MKKLVNIIGGGLAGSEAALYLADRGYKVNLVEMRPHRMTAAHQTENFAELVCSNSLKSTERRNAHGLLKHELSLLGSKVLPVAEKFSVPGGKALVVDRDSFSAGVTLEISNHPNISIIRKECQCLDLASAIIASGPLSSESLLRSLENIIGRGFLHFTDAISPIVRGDSINYADCFFASRYQHSGDYLNCPLDSESYYKFVDDLVNAEVVSTEFDQEVFFYGCMPVEEIARRGRDSLRFSLLKPKGLIDPRNGKQPFAVCQLRREDIQGNAWNLVGFQTRLKFQEQRRVFSTIPGLHQVKFDRFGQAHRNSYINAPEVLADRSLKIKNSELFIAGQLSGVEGYVESLATGLLAALEKITTDNNQQWNPPPGTTVIGGLLNHLHTAKKDFQPIAASFGLVSPLEHKIKSKKLKKDYLAERSLNHLADWIRKSSITG
ncbi:MAG: methylenetetrahydrofolate--tRNA-(uracil(54)-C(5))-methyltransferase (FADH(2)-oxidizing) TrmFO [bacterium]